MRQIKFSALVFGCAVALLAGTDSAFAADKENSESVTQETSKNPFTGTKTTTIKHKVKKKDAAGANVEVNQKETIKEKTNGQVERKMEVDGEREEKH